MSSFASALEYVHQTLSDWQARGATLTASQQSLNALAASAPPPPAPPAAPAKTAAKPEPSGSSGARGAAPAAKGRTASGPAMLPVLPRPSFSKSPTAPPGAGSRGARLAALAERVFQNTDGSQRPGYGTRAALGSGSPEAELMFVGESPNEEHDALGEPLAAQTGELLTKILTAMGFEPDEAYTAKVLKGRFEIPYLSEQIEIVQPKVLVALGTPAVEALLDGATEPIQHAQGQWRDFKEIPLLVTYSLAHLLQNQSLSEKRRLWEDMLLVLEKLGRPISEKQRAYFLPKE